MRKIVSALIVVLLCFSMAATAQVKTITGKVTDDKGNAVPYSSVTVKGTNTGASADNTGSFSIKAKPGSTLVFSALGFQNAEFVLKNSTDVAITLAQNNDKIAEVVVTTALGLKRSRSSLGYAAQQVGADELNRTPNTNFVNNLSGKVAGLQITAATTMGGSTNAILRGMKSLTQSNQALFVVDGVPYDNTNQSRGGFDLGNAASDINPDDIESITVLKGAAASALYGSRASNGVIAITTKKGHKGKGLGVTVNVGVQLGSPDKSTLPTYQTIYGEGYGSAGNDPGGPNIPGFFYYTPTFNSPTPVKVVQTDVDAGTGPAYDPSIMVYNWDAFSPGNPNYGKATPWQPAAHNKPTDFFVTPVTTTTSVSIDGGGDKSTFKLSYNNNTDKGMIPNSHILKNQLGFASTYTVADGFTVGATAYYTADNALNRNLYSYSGTTNIMSDFRQWWPTNVDISELKSDYYRTFSNATWNWLGGYTTNVLGNIAKPAYHNNPYWQVQQNYENDSRDRIFGNVYANYKINSHFNLLGRVSLDNYNQKVETRTNVGSVEQSGYSRINIGYSQTSYDFLFNYDQTFGKFNVKALLGGNVTQQVNQAISSSSNGGLVIPSFFSLSNSVKTPLAPSESYSQKEVDGIFAGATVSYKEMLTLDGTIRRDQSSTLPKANNSYYYPSVTGNFVFSKVLSSLTWLSYGKLRANYAQVGGDAPVFSLQNTYAAGTAFNSQTVFSAPGTNNNPALIPETNKSYEFGVEASFLRSRIGFDVTYYHSQQINQIMPVTVSRASGYSTFYVNGGTVQNAGVELTVNLVPVRVKNFTWNLSVNWTKNNNKVISLYNNQPSYTIAQLQNSIQIVAEAGHPYGVLRGTDYMYLNGQPEVDATGHYILNSNSHVDIGNMNPNWFGGISNSFSYKNLALSFLIDVRQGGQVYSLDMDYGSSSGLYPQNGAFLNDLGKLARSPLAAGGGIILKGVNASDGKPNTTRIDESDINSGNYSYSSAYGESDRAYVYDASYVKLRELAITYSLPAKVITKIGFLKGIDVALTGRNLWIIHKNVPYADPEQGQASGNASMGFQQGVYPTMRTIGCNVKLKF